MKDKLLCVLKNNAEKLIVDGWDTDYSLSVKCVKIKLYLFERYIEKPVQIIKIKRTWWGKKKNIIVVETKRELENEYAAIYYDNTRYDITKEEYYEILEIRKEKLKEQMEKLLDDLCL